MTGKAAMSSHAIVMGILTLSLLSFMAPNVQAKRKVQLCPPGDVMVGLKVNGRIVCAALESDQPRLTERYVFVSSTYHTGDLGGVVGADRICTNLAMDAKLYRGQPFKAWLSDDIHSPNSYFVKSGIPYVDVIGRRVADDYEDLTDGSLKNDISHDEKGNEVLEQTSVWTSTFPDGTSTNKLVPGAHCSRWTSESEGDIAIVGSSWVYEDEGWTVLVDIGCETTSRIYCFEQ